jgi:thioredoxin 1
LYIRKFLPAVIGLLLAAAGGTSAFVGMCACGGHEASEKNTVAESTSGVDTSAHAATGTTDNARSAIKVTFVELGSENCIPCRMMKPVMEKIRSQYSGQVRVVFYDVWTAEGRPQAVNFGIRAIPTQIFLDANGNEFFRHEGFFSEEEIVRLLRTKGVQ